MAGSRSTERPPSGRSRVDPADRIVVATGQRPDLAMTRELRLELDPWLESVKALGPLIDPNLHSCGSVAPHGYRELAHPEPGFYTIGVKSYGRAPTFLLLTGYEQARSVAAAIAGDLAAAESVHLVLPETGICQDQIVEVSAAARLLRRPGAGRSGCLLHGGCRGQGRPARPGAGADPLREGRCRRGAGSSGSDRTGICHHGARPDADPGLGLVLLSPGRAAPRRSRPIPDGRWPGSSAGLSLGLIAAGLISPRVGRTIEHHGGRPVLAASAGLFAAGLCGLAAAPVLPVYLASWLVLGLAMGAGLYDAAFATLGRLYGQSARQAITALTLFGGFASTACWPLSAWLATSLGWRGTCLVYAALHLAIALPLYVFALPQKPERRALARTGNDPGRLPAAPLRSAAVGLLVPPARGGDHARRRRSRLLMSVHLLSILQERDVALAAAVALGVLVGPSQVGARAIEMLIGRYHHPIWTMVASMVLVAAGVGLLWAGLPIVAVALVFYGAGIGLESIARGTLPLALFGASGYATLMGRLAMPSLLAQAASPFSARY